MFAKPVLHLILSIAHLLGVSMKARNLVISIFLIRIFQMNANPVRLEINNGRDCTPVTL